MAPSDGHTSADPGALLATTHEVGDGVRVRLRLTRPSDATAIQEFLGDAGEARRFAFYDARTRVVIAATRPVDGREQIVGLADGAHVHVEAGDLHARRIEDLLHGAFAALAARQGRQAA